VKKDQTQHPHKLGAKRNETAVKPRKHAENFKQSRDVREDRSRRQIKAGDPVRTMHGR
jgi:hypothetical protein